MLQIPPSMALAQFRVAKVSLYPLARTPAKAARVLAEVQRRLSRPLTLVSTAPHPNPESAPLFRIDASLAIDVTGAYATLSFLLEFFRPVSEFWHVTLPVFGLPLEGAVLHEGPHSTDPSATWQVWGHAPSSSITGLASLYFTSETASGEKPGAA